MYSWGTMSFWELPREISFWHLWWVASPVQSTGICKHLLSEALSHLPGPFLDEASLLARVRASIDCSILDDCLWRRYFQSHDFKDGARSKDLYITLSCQERDTRECAGLQHVTLGCLAGWVVVWQPVEHPTGSESSKGSSQHGRLHQKDQCWSW